MRTFTLSIIEGDAGPDAVGSELDDAPFKYDKDLDDETTKWLDANGYDPEHPDRWVLVTRGGENPQAVNVIASRDVTVAVHPLGVLNTAIITADGEYTLRTITLDEAKNVTASAYLDSAVGHEATAVILSELLGVEVPVNRQLFAQKPGQRALVFKLSGRPPEGVVLDRAQMEEIGFTFKLLTRVR